MPRVNEWIIRLSFISPASNVAVRVWAKAEDVWNEDERTAKIQAVGTCVHETIQRAIRTHTVLREVIVAEDVAKFDFCNAVEVIFDNNSGIVIYPEWP